MTQFNQLTPAQAERLAVLAEECAEVVMAVGKILRHGYENYNPDSPEINNRMQLLREITDVFSVVEAMRYLDFRDDIPSTDGVWSRKLRYMHHQ